MSVDVTMLPATIPSWLQDEDISRRRQYKDRDGASYSYSVHPSGALVIWHSGDSGAEPEATIGATAWEEVQGDTFVSLV